MNRACTTSGSGKNLVDTKFWPENQKRRDHFGGLEEGGRVILKRPLK
jgi:hypothetical protein